MRWRRGEVGADGSVGVGGPGVGMGTAGGLSCVIWATVLGWDEPERTSVGIFAGVRRVSHNYVYSFGRNG